MPSGAFPLNGRAKQFYLNSNKQLVLYDLNIMKEQVLSGIEDAKIFHMLYWHSIGSMTYIVFDVDNTRTVVYSLAEGSTALTQVAVIRY